MEVLYDSMSVLEALYDLKVHSQSVTEEIAIMSHNYKKTGDPEMLTEGCKDLLDLIISGIKSFIQKIRDLIKKHTMILNSYHMEYSKLIEKYSEVVMSAEIQPFHIEGFNFTVLTNPRPDVSEVHGIIEEFNNDIAKFSSLTIEDIRELKLRKSSDISFERLRGKVLGVSSRIDPQDFRKYAHSFYRGNSEYPNDIVIDKDYINTIIKNSEMLIKEKKTTSIDKDSIMGTLSRLEKFFSTKVSRLYDDIERVYNVSNLQKNGETSDDSQRIEESEMSKLVMYLSNRYQQAVELSNIISVVFVERISAIKDQMNQESQIIRTALKQIQPAVFEGFMETLENVNSYPPTPNTNWAPIWEGISTYGGDE